MNSNTNNDLLGFDKHWKLDGDYLRCRKCNRPHIASRSDMAFVHMSGCKLEGVACDFPWQRLQQILNGPV